MKGIELCERFYYEYGEAMLRERFPEIFDLVAIGIVGSGSECFGYDDEISRDHDFEPGFCIFLPSEQIVDSKTEFALERAYSKLPREFMGVQRSLLKPVGGNRHGVIRISDFLLEKTGRDDGELSIDDWFCVPEQSLLELTNGKIFLDRSGVMSDVRKRLEYLPEAVRRKKLAGELLIMAQSGQYNYQRCILRGETAAAQLALAEFVKSTLHAVFLLNKKYMPYYKWCFRALRDIDSFSDIYSDLEYLISSSNSESEAIIKKQKIEFVCARIFDEIASQKLCERLENNAEEYAYAVNDSIVDHRIRNLHVLYGI